MLFLILCTDRQDASELRQIHRPRHVEYWQALGNRVKLGGPFLNEAKPDGAAKGSMLVVEAESEAEARRLADNDPFTIEKVFAEIRVEPFRATLGEWPPR
jgi:uncharacterized protein YciI